MLALTRPSTTSVTSLGYTNKYNKIKSNAVPNKRGVCEAGSFTCFQRYCVTASVVFLIGMAGLFSGSSTSHRKCVHIRKEKKESKKREKAALIAIEGQVSRIPHVGTDI
jgi:hypothetical protein